MTPLKLLLVLVGCLALCRHAAAADPTPTDYRHLASGMVFPAKIAGFQRIDIVDSADAQRGFRVRYQLAAETSDLDIFVRLFPLRDVPSQQLDDVSRDAACRRALLVSNFDTVEPLFFLTGRPVVHSLPNHPPAVGDVEFSFFDRKRNGKSEKYRALIYRYCPIGGSWLIQYEFYMPEDDGLYALLGNFMAELLWPRTPLR